MLFSRASLKSGSHLFPMHATVLAITLGVAGPLQAGEKLEYNRDIRPILAENCFACHGPDSAARKKDLRLDIREQAIAANAIIPHKPDESRLIERIMEEEPSRLMPPPKTKKFLTKAQKETLRRWINEGAEYQPHWSFIRPTRPQIPVVKDASWVRNPIDNFVLAALEKQGLKPAPEADRRTLARRLSLDLIGLPPKPEEVEAFVNDSSPEAYDKYVDRLMSSPHWGEHRGRYWLDAARYADTHGLHFDNYREMWLYRDWVIKAFNKNMPFDQFTIEQLAGDLLPNRTLEQQVASGFNRCHITTNEGGAIEEEFLVLYTRERTETTAQVWLGLSAGCAVCHDHKFDPLSQREFYELAAFFNNTTQKGLDGNIKDTPPIVFVPHPRDRKRQETLSKALKEVRQQVEARRRHCRPEFDKWLAEPDLDEVTASVPSDGLKVHAALNEGQGKLIQVKLNGEVKTLSLPSEVQWEPGHVAAKAFKSQVGNILEIPEAGDFEKDQPFSCGAWIKLPRGGVTGSIVARMGDLNDLRGWDLWIGGNLLGAHINHEWPDDAIMVVSRNPIRPRDWNHVLMTYDGSGKAAGVKLYVNGQLQPATVQADTLKNSVRTSVPLKIAQRNSTARLDNLLIQDVRVYDRVLTHAEVERIALATRAAALLEKPATKRTPADHALLFDWWLKTQDQAYPELAASLNKLTEEQVAIRSRATIALVMQEKPQEAMAQVLFRGDYDKPRDTVKARTPSMLPPMPDDLPRNRLGFAQWLLRPENPLTARVTVNRFWQEVFGTGIVRTSGDFGIAGELPSHPELLDWLALEFMASGGRKTPDWDVKKFFKLLVTSATYRQAALATPEKLQRDPQNRLLSRGPRFRMDAEMIRDHALAVSGLLVPKIGGPSVKPYQPEGVWEAVAMIGSNTRHYKQDSGENLYRRSLYTFWKRSAPPASMEILNAPNRETCTVRRERTNTPLQALVTLNDPQFVEAARHLAQHTLKEGGDEVTSRFDYLSRRLLARPFYAEEVKIAQRSLNDLLTYYQSHPEDAKKLIAVGASKADPSLDASELAAWTMLANELMNLDEVLNK